MAALMNVAAALAMRRLRARASFAERLCSRLQGAYLSVLGEQIAGGCASHLALCTGVDGNLHNTQALELLVENGP